LKSFTILYDNNSYQENIKTGWGFSCLIQGTEKTILFDTGGEDLLLLRNMQKLAINPNCVDVIVLSHFHSDHTGGLWSLLKIHPKVTILVPNSFPRDFIDQLIVYGSKVVEVGKAEEVCKDVYSAGELGEWMKEQSLMVETNRGIILLTGCAHPGIVQIVKEVKALTNENILLLIGGFHLKDHSQVEIEGIIDHLNDLGVQYISPTHCTGEFARNLFKERFANNYLEVGAGKRIILEELY
jgi:7,8-dihydropterin-6-yl-methyl-4-(beta-D-ribofuranosyl)aminobenzene 5'-phosphate synthase